MPWLTQTVDIGRSFAQGAQGGAAVAGAINQGRQVKQQGEALALRRMQVEADMRAQNAEMQQRAALMPIQLKLKEQEVEAQGLAIGKQIRDRDYALNASKAYNSAVTSIADDLASGKPDYDKMRSKVLQVGVSYQNLLPPNALDGLLKQIDTSQKFSIDLAEVTARRTFGTANIQDVQKMADLRAQIADLPEDSPERIEFETQLSDLTAKVKGQQQLRARELDLKAAGQTAATSQRERRLRLQESLPPVQEAALKAELAIVDDSLKLMNDDAAKAAKVAEIIAKYERMAGQSSTATKSATSRPSTNAPTARWDPVTRRVIPTTNAPVRGLSPSVDALDPVTVP